ncbi:hypothetical protein TSUD_154380 [Trifolium subterraneum]|uniref:Pentatricopeptide repeat-containing protein n=1 Tax=Trifolium subterraneum TaxID=3900 RepID=A0A2Z6N9F6_TRISU|nr:hypothetical protein TSUD_154380 [Trifolium subterraneum]
MQQALQIHAHIIVTGRHNNLFLSTTLFSIYASKSLHHSHILFSQITNPDVFLWNAIIKAYSNTLHSPPPVHPFSLFKSMLSSSISPDSFTFPFLLKSCANMLISSTPQLGFQVHCHVIRNGFDSDVFVNNALLNFYCVFGDVDNAYKVFEESPVRDCVSCNTMINGFVRAGVLSCCFRVFGEMRRFSIRPDEYTFVALLSCCSLLEDYRIGRQVHGLVYRELGYFGENVLLVNKIVDMYAKCGYLDMAERVVRGVKADTDQHDEAASLRKEIDNVGIRKPPGWSYVETNGTLHKFVAGDKSHPEAKTTELMLRDINTGLKYIGHISA